MNGGRSANRRGILTVVQICYSDIFRSGALELLWRAVLAGELWVDELVVRLIAGQRSEHVRQRHHSDEPSGDIVLVLGIVEVSLDVGGWNWRSTPHWSLHDPESVGLCGDQLGDGAA